MNGLRFREGKHQRYRATDMSPKYTRLSGLEGFLDPIERQ